MQASSRYAWVIVAIGMISGAAHTTVVYSGAVFLIPIVRDTGWSHGSVSAGISMAILGLGVWSPVVGAIVRWATPRWVLSIGALFLSGSLLLLSQVQSQAGFWLLMVAPVSLGAVCVGSVPNFTAVRSWFGEQRGLAFSITDSGSSVGIAVCVPLVYLAIDSYGWRTAYQLLAIAMLFLAPMHFLLQREVPRIATTTAHSAEAERPSTSIGDVLRHPHMWLIFVGVALAWFSVQPIMFHFPAFLSNRGFSADAISTTLLLIGIFGLGGRIGFGWLSDRIGTLKAFALVSGTVSAGILAVLGAGFTQMAIFLLLFGLFFGTSHGAGTIMYAKRNSESFPSDAFGLVFGISYVGASIGGTVGTALAGYVFDWTGSYVFPFLLSIVTGTLSIFCMYQIRSRQSAAPHVAAKASD